jgi:hypothetical protein
MSSDGASINDRDVMGDISDRFKAAGKYIYWTVGLIIIGGISYVLYNRMERQIAAVLFFIAGILALYFYYVKWFIVSKARRNLGEISSCPDYLTLVPVPLGTGQTTQTYTCMDFVGVSRNGGILETNPEEAQSKVLDPSYTFAISPNEDPDALRNRLRTAGLTWISLLGND